MSHGLGVGWYRRRSSPLSSLHSYCFSVKSSVAVWPSRSDDTDGTTAARRPRLLRHRRGYVKPSVATRQQDWKHTPRNDPRSVAPPPIEQHGNNATDREDSSSPLTDTTSLLQNWLNQLQSPPNLLTLSRIAATPLLSYWVVTHQTVPAIVGCCIAAASDAADGFLARNCNMATTLGTYLDPLADKLLINALAISLWVNGTLPTTLITVWLAKDVALMVATYVYVAQRTAKGLTVWDPVTVPLQVNPTTISKVNTGLQFLTLSLGIAHPLVAAAAVTATTAAADATTTHILTLLSGPALPALCWLTGATTILSVASYVVGRSAFTEVQK